MRLIRAAILALAWAAPAMAEVIDLPSRAGAERFGRAATDPEALALMFFVETEARLTFCGPASLAAALNSLHMPGPTPVELYPFHLLTQNTVFTPENQAVKSYAKVEQAGLTLQELAQFAANLHTRTETLYASDVGLDAMRDRLRQALATPNTRVLLNYARQALMQEGAGHISPIAAYDTPTDSFLIIDVARYKYPPVWVTFPQLYAAMQGIDTDSGRSRGALLLSRLPNEAL